MAKKFDFLSPGVEIREIDQSFLPQEAEAEGPIIIGRTLKGPANKPVRVRNLDDFVSVFGMPVPGGVGQGDVWREGNVSGPTYASYAAQAWLASENSPITFVRLAGEASPDVAGEGGKAGWQVGSGGIQADGTNSTAYGLFLCDSADAAEASSRDLDFASYDVTKLGGSSTFAVLSFFHLASLASSPAFTVAGGLAFQINFDESATKGSIVKIANGGGNGSTGVGRSQTGGVVNVYSIGVASTPSETEVIGYIETAITQALTNGDVSNISVENTGTSLSIFNLDTSKEFNLADKSQAGTHHGNAVANFQFAAGLNNAYGTELAVATVGASNGALAAVLYSVTGALGLKGTSISAGTSGTSGVLLKSLGKSSEFALEVYSSAGVAGTAINFNFDRASEKYIRNVLNTNPQLTNAATISSTKSYWLGETYADHVSNFVTSTTTGDVYGILLPLGKGADTLASNWGYQRKNATEAKSGWVIAQKPDEAPLFRFKCLHVGEEIQKNYLISIEDLALPNDSTRYNYGTFTVAFKTISGTTVERYTGCSLDPNSANYVAKRIGDQYLEWDATNKRYRTYGDYQNQSDLFYIEMDDSVDTQGLLPMGFRGPVRPKGFGLLVGETSPKTLDLSDDFANAAVRSGDDSVVFKGHLAAGASTSGGDYADLDTATAVKFVFPKLRLRNNGTDGGASNPARSYWGVRPKISSTSTQHDPDFCDYLRGIPEGFGGASHVPGSDFEYSFIFRMEDIEETTGVWTWVEGQGTTKSVATLISDGARQFAMPVWGGSDGFEITEMEPMRNSLIASAGAFDENNNYVDYTISKAIDSISDPEVVPANLLLAPGFYRPAVTNKLITVAENRKDVLAIIDIENDYVPRFEGLASSLGSTTTAVSTLKARRLNSSYACTFYPWVQISDNLNGSNLVWVPPSVAGLGALGRSQAQSELWFAPAGFNRGGLGSLGGPRGPAVLQARQRLDSKERDLLYEQNINPIATFPAEGVVIFGQKTLQADGSALDRINVRRLLLFLKSRVGEVSRNLLFDQNLQSTWNRFKGQVEPLLADTQARFGLSGYKLILDETTTTADLIDRNIMYAKIYVKPARAIEYIVVDFVITRTGADFV